jgi:hypothetical protein
LLLEYLANGPRALSFPHLPVVCLPKGGTISRADGHCESAERQSVSVQIQMAKSKSLSSAGHYDANYGNFQTGLYAEIRHEAFGEDIGQNSWLTAAEQDRFLKWLYLTKATVLLDVACGAGVRHCGSPLSPDVLLLASMCMKMRSPQPSHLRRP